MPHTAPPALRFFAVASPGLQRVLAEELRELPELHAVAEERFGVSFEGGLAAAFTANYGSRIATRILARVGQVRATDFGQLRRGLSALPLEDLVSGREPLRVEVKAHRCRLRHTRALAEIVEAAIDGRVRPGLADAQRGDGREAPFGHEPFARILLRGTSDLFELSVDTSGLLLHRRGTRPEGGEAPLRETLAAGVLRLCDYRGQGAVVDPMCGSGTFAIEAAEIACKLAPGRTRSFAIERFPAADARRFAEIRARFQADQLQSCPVPIVARDIDGGAVERTVRNLERAGLAGQIDVARADARAFAPRLQQGLLVSNPPYGKRLGKRGRDNNALLRSLGGQLRRRYRGFDIGLLLPRDVEPALLRLDGCERIALRNGGLPVQLLSTRARLAPLLR